MLQHHLGLRITIRHARHHRLLMIPILPKRIPRVVRPQRQVRVAPLRHDAQDEIVVVAIRRSEPFGLDAEDLDHGFFDAPEFCVLVRVQLEGREVEGGEERGKVWPG